MSRATRLLPVVAVLGLVLALGPVHAGFKEAQQNMSAGRFAEAAQELQTLIETSGEWSDGHFLLGTCYLQMRRLDQAVNEFEKAIEINPERFDYHARLALTLFTKKDYPKTIDVMNVADRLATGPAQIAYLSKYRGLSYAYLGNHSAAVANLKKAMPAKDALVASVLGTACFKTGEYPCAIENLRLATQADPKDFDLVYYLARAHLFNGRTTKNESQKKTCYRSAVTEAKKAVALKPSSIPAQKTLAKAHLGAGDLADAERLFNTLVQREPRDCTHYLDLLTTLREREKWTNVVTIASKVTGGQGPTCEQREKSIAWTHAGFAWLRQSNEGRPDTERLTNLGRSISASRKAIDLGAGGFAQENLKTAQGNLERLQANIQDEEAFQAQREAQCRECLKQFDFQQKTVAFLQETDRTDVDGDGVSDANDSCADTPPWVLVDKAGCRDTKRDKCNAMLADSWCQDLHEGE
jgi:tetratricopeptide (TPR) repeat protein